MAWASLILGLAGAGLAGFLLAFQDSAIFESLGEFESIFVVGGLYLVSIVAGIVALILGIWARRSSKEAREQAVAAWGVGFGLLPLIMVALAVLAGNR